MSLPLDYIAALGQEFSAAIDPEGEHDLSPQDAYDALLTVLGGECIAPPPLSGLGAAEREALAKALSDQLEVLVQPDAVNRAIERLLRRWPAEDWHG